MLPSFQAYKFWKKYVEKRIVTDEGMFAEDQVPENYGGPELEVEVIQRAIFCDSAGHIMVLQYDDMTGVKDKERQTGLGATLEDTGETVVEAKGPSSQMAKWKPVLNESLSDEVKARAEAMYQHYQQTKEDQPV